MAFFAVAFEVLAVDFVIIGRIFEANDAVVLVGAQVVLARKVRLRLHLLGGPAALNQASMDR